MFEASHVALQLVAAIRPIVEAIADQDANLAGQLRRAATSAALNTAEAGRREGRDKRSRARTAAGEAAEAVQGARIAAALGYVTDEAVVPVAALADRLQAMLWRVRHPRR